MASVITADGKTVEIKQPNNEYWDAREEARAKRLYDQADNSYGELRAIFKKASDEMTAELRAFYEKYGVTSQSPVFETLEDGTQVIVGTNSKRIVPANEAYAYNRLDKLNKELNVILSEMAKEQNAYMITNLKLLAQETYNALYFQTFQGYGVGYSFAVLDPKVITQLIRNPVHGQDFSTRVWKNKDLLANRVQQELVNGITQGISTREMTKRVSGQLYYRGEPGTAYKVAERLMRTEITNTYNQATLQGYKNSGIVDEYQYLATLDNRTSDVCQELDGQVFKVKNATAGLNFPVMHVNCRSTTVAKFDAVAFTRRARDDQGNTYTVPASMTYKEWAKVANVKPIY